MMTRWWTAFPAPCTTGYFPIYLAHLGQPFPASYMDAAEALIALACAAPILRARRRGRGLRSGGGARPALRAADRGP